MFVSFPSEKEALAVSEKLVEKELAACASIHPVKSVYFWQGKLHKEGEWEAVFKVAAESYKEFESLLVKEHSYEVPQVVAVKAEAVFEKYLKWARSAKHSKE